MKRSMAWLAAIPLMLAPAVAQAQGGFGIKGGVAFADVDERGVLPGSLEGRTGWTGGLYLGTPPAALGLNIEALYARRNFRGPDNTSTRRLDYIDVPAYLRLMLPTSSISPYFYAGPQLSIELNCRAGDDSDCPDAGRSSTSWSAVIGGGLRLGNRGAFTLEGRYVYGLTDLDFGTITSSDSYRQRTFLILGGIGF